MRFASLGSGSEGNALIVESSDGVQVTRVLIDCGFSLREARRRLQSAGIEPGEIHGILVTHEHGDHVGGVFRLSAAHGIPVFLTHGTLAASLDGADQALEPEAAGLIRRIMPDQAFEVGGLQILPVAVPHDAKEPVQYVMDDGRHKLGVLTDLGHGSTHVRRSYGGLDALVLECNHDTDMLAANTRYPEVLKRRISGPWGHLANHVAGELLASLDTRRLRVLVAAHLSRQNNSPELARQALADALDSELQAVGVADQDAGFAWTEV
jgi:phosphoribosyl 1,2-cyclic phosphodiesterase